MKHVIDSILAKMAYWTWDKKQGGIRLQEMSALQKSQWYSKTDIEHVQNHKLADFIQYAAKNSPWYKNIFSEHQIDINQIQSISDLTCLPITTKTDIRENERAFISDEFDIDSLIRAKTGGSTGVSLNLYFDETCQKLRNAAQGFTDNWAGWHPGARVAALWGNPPVYTTIKEKLRSALLGRTIYLDTMDMNDNSMQCFVDECASFKPEVLFGHAHSIYLFAKYLNKNNINPYPVSGIVATSMMLLDKERELIESTFSVAVTNRYGCEEVGLIACECEEHNGMHINSTLFILECLDENNQPVVSGQPGKLVVTDLNNFAMPLIRYRIEDVGVLSNKACGCGRGLPLLERLEGRVADFLKKKDGSFVAGVSLVERTLTKVSGLEQMQLIQDSIDNIVVNRVKANDYNDDTDRILLSELRAVFGDQVTIQINDVPAIPQERSGKYRFSICNV